MIMKKLIFACVLIAGSTSAMAQTYSPKVSKDSLSTLSEKVDVLKQHMKVLELKIKEAEEETNVEKLRLKLLEIKGNAKESADKASRNIDKTDAGSSVDLKNMAKLSKKAKSDADESQKALSRYNKQISKVEDIRTQIQGAERKLGYKKPQLVYDYK